MKKQTSIDQDVVNALVEAPRDVSKAAEALGMSQNDLSARMNGSGLKRLAGARMRAAMVHHAQVTLFEAVRTKQPWAIRFLLAGLDKSYRYASLPQVDVAEDEAGRLVILLSANNRDRVANTLGDSLA